MPLPPQGGLNYSRCTYDYPRVQKKISNNPDLSPARSVCFLTLGASGSRFGDGGVCHCDCRRALTLTSVDSPSLVLNRSELMLKLGDGWMGLLRGG